MTQLKLSDVSTFIGTLFPEHDSLIFENAIDRNAKKSIGVFTAPEARMGKTETYGGKAYAPVEKFPVNILIRWTDDSSICEDFVNEMYQKLSSVGNNFFIRDKDYTSAKIAYFHMLDSNAIWLGRETDNVCEYSIRVDIYYYN